jgi:hypothetical protein
MRPRSAFPVRPFDSAPPIVVDAAKRLFALRKAFYQMDPLPVGQHPLPSVVVDGGGLYWGSYRTSI